MYTYIYINDDEWVSDFLLTNRTSRRSMYIYIHAAVFRSVKKRDRGKKNTEEGIFRFVLGGTKGDRAWFSSTSMGGSSTPLRWTNGVFVCTRTRAVYDIHCIPIPTVVEVLFHLLCNIIVSAPVWYYRYSSRFFVLLFFCTSKRGFFLSSQTIDDQTLDRN